MGKIYTEKELLEMGLDVSQVKIILDNQVINSDTVVGNGMIPANDVGKTVDFHKHDVSVKVDAPLVPTSISQIASYKDGAIVELPSFADGQPFVARLRRPLMSSLIRSGKIPNSLISQATSLFANGAGALGNNDGSTPNMSELFEVIDVIVESALLEPTLSEIRSVGMELTDDQQMAIFAYTQRGVKALEQFRTK